MQVDVPESCSYGFNLSSGLIDNVVVKANYQGKDKGKQMMYIKKVYR